MGVRDERLAATDLPVLDVLDDVQRELANGAAVLEAPPGAGKTTIVPLALLEEPWLEGKRILMLEPRRLAARAAASRMAFLLNEEVGETVGYRVRLDTKVSRRTRIEVVTEGILTRMLQDDPMLENVGLVIFDEYHERNLQADLGLALCLDIRAGIRPDLRLLVMSATLDAGRMAKFLDAPLIKSEGRRYDVEVIHRPIDPGEHPIDHAVRVIVEAMNHIDGDVLVFLPGEGEIRQVGRRVADSRLPEGVEVIPLYGSLSLADQERAIQPSPPGRRKVVLSTNIAETSLTIEGVRAVVDSGLVRRPRFDADSGMTSLETVRISRSSARQRAGRAGRLAPGVCFRMVSRLEDDHLHPHDPPEIAIADLTSLALELSAWGVRSADELRWLDPPPQRRLDNARELLRELGAVDESRSCTRHGKELVRYPAHPRLAHMLVLARERGEKQIAALLAAAVTERDIIRWHGSADPDVRLRLDLLCGSASSAMPRGAEVRRGALRHTQRVARRLTHGSLPSSKEVTSADIGRLLALAYPERVAMKETDGTFRLRSGERVSVSMQSHLHTSRFIVAAHVGGGGARSRLFLGAPIDVVAVRDLFKDGMKVVSDVFWDDARQAVVAEVREMLGALILDRREDHHPDPERIIDAFLDHIRDQGIQMLPWSREAEHLRQRIQFLHCHDPSWPDVSDEALLSNLAAWLRPFLSGMRRSDDLNRLDLANLLMNMVGWERSDALDRLAPSHHQVPSGSRIRIDYSDPEAPVLAVRIQEMFGATETPRIMNGRVPLTLHLLSPAHRPAQITQDLEGFWTGAYFDVRRDLRGRYPKHDWPEDPLNAAPASRPSRRR